MKSLKKYTLFTTLSLCLGTTSNVSAFTLSDWLNSLSSGRKPDPIVTLDSSGQKPDPSIINNSSGQKPKEGLISRSSGRKPKE